MTNLESYSVGFHKEATFGVADRNAIPANTNTFQFFEGDEPFTRPGEQPILLNRPAFDSYTYGSSSLGRTVNRWSLRYDFIEYVHLKYALGYCDLDINAGYPTGADPYTHYFQSITPTAGGPTLPSRTVHLESTGLSTQELLDVLGCTTEQLDLFWNVQEGRLYAVEKFRFQRVNDENAGSNTPVAYSGGTLGPCQSGLDANDVFKLTSVKYGTGPTDIIADVRGINIRIVNTLLRRALNRTTSDDYSNTMNRYASAYHLQRQEFYVTLELWPTDLPLPLKQ